MARFAPPPSLAAGFLIAQVGGYAASQFAEALKPHGFAPHDAGILRLIGNEPAISQQEIAKRLRMHASRLVGLIDDLEERGMIERRPSEKDRRLYALHLTGKGEQALTIVSKVGREHSQKLLAVLSEEERVNLSGLLTRVAESHGLVSGVHPGYSKLGGKDT
ncbi:MarR family winged helix-turn-helix transcriptional regulator [Edaphobacter flagellatus]|uniref:MarR family winged helix-turn-helix transcriptional regulator n=1 Tax=Edaphobacter flagellatus TaxID=1933044 RepID=UPI0021B38FC1|nr:MarR family transcriptional regulator [Edaphobacter flagellatus]